MSEIFTVATALLLAVGLVGEGSGESDDRDRILEHLHGIFRAYVDRDREAIERMHTVDWTGFFGPSTGIERGLTAYMANADRSLESFLGTGYELLDTDIQLYGDVAIVYYVARYDFRDREGRPGSLPLRAVDVYRRENGSWNQSGSHITPIPRSSSWGEEDGSLPRALSEQERDELLKTREAVWRAWFDGDREALERLVPEETIAIDPGVETWADQDEVVQRARAFRDAGSELRRLEFPETRMQVYGNVVILYTKYLFEFATGGAVTSLSGRGTEVFVRRNGQWLNSGWHLDSGS